jgi:hypothetical protein
MEELKRELRSAELSPRHCGCSDRRNLCRPPAALQDMLVAEFVIESTKINASLGLSGPELESC